MKKKLIVTRKNNIVFSALLDDENKALEIGIDDPKDMSIVDNIYIGRVQNVLPNIHASFVEYQKGKTAFIPDILKSGEKVMVQVVKDAIKGKEPVLSRHPVLTGKYVILTSRHLGIHFSYKFTDQGKKDELKASFDERNIDDCGFIIRTKSMYIDNEIILKELDSLYIQYKELFKASEERKLFSKIYEAQPSYLQYILNSREDEFSGIVTDDERLYESMASFLKEYQESDLNILELYDSSNPVRLNVVYDLKKQLHEAFSKKVYLPSGGYLIVEHTEALTVIDVNSGGDVTNKPSSTQYLRINLEAAKEAARQIRLRNISGIILIDFINMADIESKKILLEGLKKYLDKDPMGPNVVDMTKLGIVEITRKRARKTLAEAVSEHYFD